MKAKVLFISDDAVLKASVPQMLEKSSIEAFVADTVRNAVTYLKENPLPHLMILDLSLSDNHAMALLNQMRKQTFLAELPVLILVADPDPIQIREALQAGANRYLTKMFVGSNLLSTIRDMLVSE